MNIYFMCTLIAYLWILDTLDGVVRPHSYTALFYGAEN